MSAERWAAIYLWCKGYRIVTQRYRNAYGEIDIVATKGDMLVAIEVKARRSLASCSEAIAPWKQKKIMRAMQGLLSGKIAGLRDDTGRNIRFDVIWIVPFHWPVHIKDAWRE